jgi:hypothetical protein
MRRRAYRAAGLLASILFLVVGTMEEGRTDTNPKKGAAAATKKSGAKTAPAKPQPTWKFGRSSGSPTLEYSLAGDVLISFSCQVDAGLVRVISHIGSRGVRPGDSAAILLVNGKSRFEVAGTAFSTQASDDVDIGGATRIDGKLFALFRSGESVVLDVPGRKRSLTVTTAKASVDAFERACATGKLQAKG